MPTTARILQLTPVSAYLASNDVGKSGIFKGGLLDPQLPIKIFIVYKILKRVYDADPAYEGVEKVGNYLFELIRKYANKAAAIVDNNTGGQVAPVTPAAGTLPVPYDWIISASSEPLATGETTVTLDGTGGTQDLRGYNIEFTRGSTTQYTTNPGDGSTWYSWNRKTGVFTLNDGAAQADERFRITPIG